MAELRTEGLTKHFDGIAALTAVTLRLEEGEVVGLIGPNGSGKTTLLNVVTGVFPPTEGRVLVDDRPISGWPPHRVARLRIGRTFQNVRLFPQLTVLENVEVAVVAGGSSRRDARDRARALLRDVGLEGTADTPGGSLAYGDQRRLEIARALGVRPRFLLLDEPGAGLNEAEGDELLRTIREIRDRTGAGVLVVDHSMRLILRLCERIHVLDDGRTLFEGTPKEVRDSPQVAEAYLGERGVKRAGGS